MNIDLSVEAPVCVSPHHLTATLCTTGGALTSDEIRYPAENELACCSCVCCKGSRYIKDLAKISDLG